MTRKKAIMKLLPVRAIRQKPSYCGPASLKMVLDYFGIKLSMKKIAHLAKTTLKDGTSTANLARAARFLGFRAITLEKASLSDLRSALKRRVPPIVRWFSTDETHYSVVVGLDRTTIALQDPELGRIRKMSVSVFLRVWFGLSHKKNYPRSVKDFNLRRMLVIEPRSIQRH